MTATTFLRGYLSFLREDGWDVALVCSDGPGLREFAAGEGVRVHSVEMKREPSPLRDLQSLVTLFLLLRRLRPDVLVYATPKASLLGSLAGWFARVPRRVYELWGLRLETTMGARRQVFRFLESLTARLSNLTIANSRSLAARASDLRVTGGKVPLVLGDGSSHGVDAEYFQRGVPMAKLDEATASKIARAGTTVVGFVGRLHPDKGIDTLFEALRICAAKGLEMQVLIVGSYEGVDVSAQADEIRNKIPVHLTGLVADPRPYIAAMDLLVLPTLREGFPNVVLECAAMKVPAVVSDATGAIDSVVDGVTGLIFPVNDPWALADRLQTLLSDPGRIAQLGIAARGRALRDFDQATVWKRHSNLFRSSETSSVWHNE